MRRPLTRRGVSKGLHALSWQQVSQGLLPSRYKSLNWLPNTAIVRRVDHKMHFHLLHLCTTSFLLACQVTTLAAKPSLSINQQDRIATLAQNLTINVLSNSSVPSSVTSHPERSLLCDGNEYGRGLEDWSCQAAANEFMTRRDIISFGARESGAEMKTPWRISGRESII